MVKKVIKGYVMSNNISAINKTERLENYLTQFSVYFDKIGNNVVNMSIENSTDLALIFSSVYKISSTCSGCSRSESLEFNNDWEFGIADPIWEFIHFHSISPTFFRVEENKFERRMCNNSQLITINMDGKKLVVGEFCPTKKILLTSDWSHDDHKHTFIAVVLSRMESIGLISRRILTKHKVKVTLGTDPEVELRNPESGEIINCGEEGIGDRVLMPNGQGRIGKDGSGSQRELRPEPSDSPEGLVINIGKLIEAALDEQWSLRGDRFSLGGHIHIGGIKESTDFISILDYFLAPLSDFNSDIRKNSRYGKPGDWRGQIYGMEYRTPPSAWLATKALATVTLKIVKLSAEKHFSMEDVTTTGSLPIDLVALGLTEEEVNIYFSEMEKLKSSGLPMDLKVAWGYKQLPKFTIEIRDSWSEEVKNYITELTRNIIIEENFNGKIIFYGLSSSRGNVFSINNDLVGKIEVPCNYDTVGSVKNVGKYGVGIPSSIRGSLSETKRLELSLKSVIRGVIDPSKYITKKKKIATPSPVPFVGYVDTDTPTWYTGLSSQTF